MKENDMKKLHEPKERTFGKLLEDLAILTQVPEVAGSQDQAQIEVDGICFSLVEGAEHDMGAFAYLRVGRDYGYFRQNDLNSLI